MTDLAQIAARYRTFAATEAAGSSESYRALAERVADSPALLGFLADLPDERRQPNLFLAAVRHVAGAHPPPATLEDTVARDEPAIRTVMLSRTTQTNEPARCAVLLPALAAVGGALALLEVGASAGLCLLPDRYGYEYGGRRLTHAGGAAPVFPCTANEATPLPDALPSVAWRAGLDLNPLNLQSTDDVAWLETLVWPEHGERLDRLKGAIEVARADPPPVHAGDLLTDLEALAAAAPAGARLVVYHTAVLTYVRPPEARRRFVEAVRRLGAVWISNEAPAVFPEIAAKAPERPHGRFLLSIDGEPVAWTAPHGQAIDWFGA